MRRFQHGARVVAALVLVLAVVAGCSGSSKKDASPATTAAGATTSTTAAKATPPIGHVFVVNLENKGFDETWGETSVAKYLNDSLVPLGKLLTQYFAVGHVSLDNYIAQVSGQEPNPATKADCVTYTEFANGTGCVYPATVKTIADQLTAAGKTWKAYQEDMGTPCRHPEIGAVDPTLKARAGDQYATRHNPFVYFHSLLDSGECAKNDVDLTKLDGDLATAATTPNLAYITPNLCNDGHDAPCVDGQPGGLKSADAFLKTLVPKILASPAYKADGLVVITFDEAEIADAEGCCGDPGGGGRIGALLISPHVRPATTDETPYNHYAMLCSLEDVFGLTHLGRAATPGRACWGKNIFDA